jgi:hypothetical protein
MHYGITNAITRQANIQCGPAEVSCTDTALFDFSFSSNLLAIMKSKSLETRLIGNGYEFSLGPVSLESNGSGFYLQFLILPEAIVRDQSIDKYNIFRSCE